MQRDTNNFMSEEKGKGRAKKLEKKVARGQLNTFDGYRECLQLGISGSPHLKVVSDPGRSQSSFHIHSSELRDLLISLLYDKGTIPRTFSLTNRHFARRIAVLHFTEWGTEEGNEPIPLAVLTEGRNCTAYSMRISRDPLHAVPLSSKILCLSNSTLNKILGIKDEEVSMVASGTKRDRNGAARSAPSPSKNSEDSHISLVSKIEKARFMVPAAFLRMWSYPLPISTLNTEREGHMQIDVSSEVWCTGTLLIRFTLHHS